MSKSGNNLLIALDCLTPKDIKIQNALATARMFSEKMSWPAHVASVVSPDQVGWPLHFTKSWGEEFHDLGQRALHKLLRRNKSEKNISADILLQPYNSSQESVSAITNEAKRKKSGAIAVITHTKKKLMRWPGSFVSSLIHQAATPVLVLNSQGPALSTVRKVLVATDFSADSLNTIDRAIEFAAGLKAPLLILNVFPTAIDKTIAYALGYAGGSQNIQAYLREEERKLHKKADTFIDKAAAHGIVATFHMLPKSDSVAEGILQYSEQQGADLIVLTEKTGPWESVILGSVTRAVLGTSAKPVLVVPEPSRQKRKRKMA